MQPTVEQLKFGKGGWLRYQSNALSAPVFVRLEDRDGRLVLVDLFIPAVEGSIDTGLLRSVPLGRIEALANEPDSAKAIREALNRPGPGGPDLRTAVSYFDTTFGRRSPLTWVVRMMDAQDPNSDEPPVETAELAPPMRGRRVRNIDPRLPMPEGRDYGDGFYRKVGAVYAQLASRVKNPVAVMAEANDVPLSTVQRWVREARRRGALPAARPGKRG